MTDVKESILVIIHGGGSQLINNHFCLFIILYTEMLPVIQ